MALGHSQSSAHAICVAALGGQAMPVGVALATWKVAAAGAGRRVADPSVHLFAEFRKADQHIVDGIASAPTLDGQSGIWDGQAYESDIVEPAAMQAALNDYMRWANIREMHQPSAVGKALEARVMDEPIEVDGKPVDGATYLKVFVQDNDAWDKVKSKVYQGFSIGGKVLNAVVRKINNVWVRVIKALRLTEISLVDRPANPDAVFLFWKGADMDPNQLAELVKMADPSKCVAMLQQMRNEAEATGDMEQAEMYTQAIKLVQQASGNTKEPAAEEAMPADDSMPEATEQVAAAAQPGDLAKRNGKQVKWNGRAWAWVRKAGRAISNDRMAAMEQVVKTLLEMMSGAGNAKAAAAFKAYSADPIAQGELAGDLAKAVKPQFEVLTATLTKLDARLANIERQPAPGGPALRPVDKTLPGQGGNGNDQALMRKNKLEKTVIPNLRRQYEIETNQSTKAGYLDQLKQAEAELAALAK